MAILFLDSSNRNMSIGLADDSGLIDSLSMDAWQTQSEIMAPEIDKMLQKHNISRENIKSIMVANGPGSYTGVRITVTIAKTICTVLDCDLYVVSSLHVLKDNDNPSICLINARSKRSYIGVYEGDKCLLNDQIMTNDKVMEYITAHPDYSICGDVEYLGLKGVVSDIPTQMFSLLKTTKKLQNPLGLVPVYMKD